MNTANAAAVEQACHHLLRNLDNAKALAQNRLVAPIFAAGSARVSRRGERQALAAVRRLLRAAAADLLAREGGPAQAHALRQHVILVRCDLGGEPHKIVAAECGLSMRQFYRERRAMLARLGELLIDRFGAQAVETACSVDVVALELARARALQYGGYADCAQLVLRSIVEASDECATVVAAECQLVSLLLDRQEFDACRTHIEELDRYLSRHADAATPLEYRRVALERRNLLWYTGNALQARCADAFEMPALERLARAGYRAAQEFTAQARTFAGRRLFECGRLVQAQRVAESADAVLYAPEQAPVEVRIALLTFLGELYSATPAQRAQTSATFLEATSLAVRHGLTELAVLAVLGLSADDALRGDAALAQSRLQEVEALARSIASTATLARVYLALGDRSLQTGDLPGAQRALTCAQAAAAPKSWLRPHIDLLAARVACARGDFGVAVWAAERAASYGRAQQDDRVLDDAQRIVSGLPAAATAKNVT